MRGIVWAGPRPRACRLSCMRGGKSWSSGIPREDQRVFTCAIHPRTRSTSKSLCRSAADQEAQIDGYTENAVDYQLELLIDSGLVDGSCNIERPFRINKLTPARLPRW